MHCSFTLIIALLLISYSLELRNGKCRMIAFEGGGTKGAYQSGAFEAMVEKLPAEEVAYDVVCGASVGTLTGLFVAAHPKGTEKVVVQKLKNIWFTIKQESIFADWPFPYIASGFFSKPSFYDSSPEIPYLQEKIKETGGKIYRKFSIGVADAQDGSYLSIDETVGIDRLPFYVAASSAMPGVFKYLKEGNRILIDGGTINNLNLRGGINRCFETVEEEDITIDVIMTNPLVAHTYDMSKSKTYDVYQRANELSKSIMATYYLQNTIRIYPKINWRYLVIPKIDIGEFMGVSLTFDQKRLLELWNMGRADAIEIMANSKGNLLDEMRRQKINGFRRKSLS